MLVLSITLSPFPPFGLDCHLIIIFNKWRCMKSYLMPSIQWSDDFQNGSEQNPNENYFEPKKKERAEKKLLPYLFQFIATISTSIFHNICKRVNNLFELKWKFQCGSATIFPTPIFINEIHLFFEWYCISVESKLCNFVTKWRIQFHRAIRLLLPIENQRAREENIKKKREHDQIERYIAFSTG